MHQKGWAEGSGETLHCSLWKPPFTFGRHLIAIKARSVSDNMYRILVVDDHEPVRRRIQTLISSRKGWSVCGEAADGLQAVEQAKSLRPDLIIMDVSMPSMNGLDATEIILREVRESRILIISQNDPEIVRRQAIEVRAHGCIEKSHIQRDLIEAVECILSGHGQTDADQAS
jgi:DNA-binding NarL/FixJ family response regulator